jgi:ribonuclease HI
LSVSKREATVFLVSIGKASDSAWALCFQPSGKMSRTNSRSIKGTTAPRAALLAVCDVLEKVTEPATLHFITDQDYIVSSISTHLPIWVKNEFKSAKGKLLANADLWRDISARCLFHTVDARRPTDDAEIEELERLKLVANKSLQIKGLA